MSMVEDDLIHYGAKVILPLTCRKDISSLLHDGHFTITKRQSMAKGTIAGVHRPKMSHPHGNPAKNALRRPPASKYLFYARSSHLDNGNVLQWDCASTVPDVYRDRILLAIYPTLAHSGKLTSGAVANHNIHLRPHRCSRGVVSNNGLQL